LILFLLLLSFFFYPLLCLENSQIKISRATFCRYRPAHILTVSFALRGTCLCTKHQHMSLKPKALKQHTTLQHTNNDVIFIWKYSVVFIST
jgi:cbb3-type cytochrome oxidase subunit 1